MTTLHTPTPWAVGTEYKDDINTSDGKRLIARVMTGGGIDSLKDEADAAYIVRCVNAHDDLVMELRALLNYADATFRIEALESGEEVGHETFPSVRAALEKATK